MDALVWPILLLALGLLLLIAEVFIPSGGLIGLLALGLLILSVWRAFEYSTRAGLNFLVALVLLLPLAVALAIHLWPRTPLARRIFLPPPDPEEVRPAVKGVQLEHLVGQFGRALTPLRPSGMVDFEGRRVDSIAEAGLIPRGALVRAIAVRGGQVIVRQAADETLEDLLGDEDQEDQLA